MGTVRPAAVADRSRPHAGPGQRHHILSVLVENKAGVLARVAGLFSRRGFNIYSLAVAPTDEDEHFSRITIVVDVESAPLEQVIMQLDKLINVVSIGELSPAEAVERELVLVTVAVGPTERSQVIQLVGVFGGEVVSVGADRITVMLAGRPEKIDDFEGLLEHYTSRSCNGRVGSPCLSWIATKTADARRPTSYRRIATSQATEQEKEFTTWPRCTTNPMPTPR